MLIFADIAGQETGRQDTIQIDETLFQKIGDGNKDAFCRLYSQTKSAVYAYSLSILHNQMDAEDAMQETYLKIRGAAHLYQPQGKPLGWILTITRNICLMKYRQQKRQFYCPEEELKDAVDFGQITDREDRIVLETAFQVLSDEECRIIVLHAVSGMKHREISELLGIPVSTVLSKYNRGLKKLRGQLEGRI